MKKTFLSILAASFALFALSCAGQPTAANAAVSLSNFDDALSDAVIAIGARVQPNTEIVVYRIAGPSNDVSEYISDELSGMLSSMANLLVLARENALDALQAEQQFQMSGLVSDASASSIGKHLGAKIVVSGTLSMFDGFSQLRLRAVDVESSALVASYSARINSADPILKGVSSNAILAQATTEDALTHLDRGKDLLAAGKYKDAASEFDQSIAKDRNLSEAYYFRAIANGGMAGIGSAKESTAGKSVATATDRAKEEIGYQLRSIIIGMTTDFQLMSGGFSLSVPFLETLYRTIYNSSLSGIRIAHEAASADNTCWVVAQLNFSDWQNEINKAVETAKQQHPEADSFYVIDGILDWHWQRLVAQQLR